MFRTRRAAAMAVVAGAAIAAQLTAVAPARAAAPTITAAVTSGINPVTRDVFVIYRDGPFSVARIHGAITGATAGEIAFLYAQQFPYKTPPVRLGSMRLRTVSAKTPYLFTVTPTLATRYSVRLFVNGAAPAPVATSPVLNLYVIAGGSATNGQPFCARPVCHQTVHFFSIVPSSALRIEMSKHLDPYFGVSLGGGNAPPPPNWLVLNAGHARESGPRKISANQFEFTVNFSFAIGGHSFSWLWFGCLRDSVSKDGLGLPGYHGCGASRVSASTPYLGEPAVLTGGQLRHRGQQAVDV